jgi:hypothetical protein
MNSAYKAWRRTNKYPRYYACLDPVVVQSQGRGIQELLNDSPIEKYFLHDDLAELYPSLRHDRRIVWLSEFLSRTDRRLPMSAFSRNKWTTGALATRFAIEEGHSRIMLLGTDCNYVEIIDGAAKGKDNELVLKERPSRNPNYFFEDYQSVGDRYQIPNPSFHSGNLHLQSFLSLAAEVRSLASGVSISIGSSKSLLHRFGVFPLEEFWRSIGRRRVQCIAIPITAREIDTVLANLRLWLAPKLRPSMFHALRGCVVHLFLDGPQDEAIVSKLRSFLVENPDFRDHFDGLRMTFFDLPRSVNYYLRRNDPKDPRFCTKSGPNVFFLATMAQCAEYEYTLQLESDCLPVRPGWLDAAEHEVTGAGISEPWVVGPGYYGESRLQASFRAHINGNAIYRTGCPQFQQFIVEEFMPLMMELISDGVNDLAYDTVMSFAAWNLPLLAPSLKSVILRTVGRWRHSDLICNYGGAVENGPEFQADVAKVMSENPAAYFIHGRLATEEFRSRFAEQASFFDADPHSSRCELAFSNFWTNASNAHEATYLGYGRGLITGLEIGRGAEVALHFLRSRSGPLEGVVGFSAALPFTSYEIAEVIVAVASGDKSFACAADRVSVDRDGATLRVDFVSKAIEALEPVDVVVVKLRLQAASGRTTVDVCMQEVTCFEAKVAPALAPISFEHVPFNSKVSEIVSEWTAFVSRGGR